jgi:quercetin dioxygenase-like cupin family protein
MPDLSARLIRYADLIPCRNAFIDTRSPGSEAKENFTLIGPGVSENPDQHVHIPEPHGFNIGAARQPGGCLNSQHSHETAEVFIVHTGNWRFMWGTDATDGSITLAPGDVISLPTHMFRGFENIGSPEETGFMFAVLGGDDPGKVTWSPGVFDLAKRYGLTLLEGGRLIDTVKGETIPEGARLQAPPTPAEIAALASPTSAQMAQGVVRFADLKPNPASPLAGPGIEECPIIVTKPTLDGFPPGPITGWWPHGFSLRCLRLASGAHIPPHTRGEPEVVMLHQGTLEITVDGQSLTLGAGDTFTTPRHSTRSFRATSSDGCTAYIVRGGDAAGAVRFVQPVVQKAS